MTQSQGRIKIDVGSLYENDEKLEWMLDAACRYALYPDRWFAPSNYGSVQDVLDVCLACPVIDLCREYNDRAETGKDGRQVSKDMIHGIYAAETPIMRRRRRKGRKYPYAKRTKQQRPDRETRKASGE